MPHGSRTCKRILERSKACIACTVERAAAINRGTLVGLPMYILPITETSANFDLLAQRRFCNNWRSGDSAFGEIIQVINISNCAISFLKFVILNSEQQYAKFRKFSSVLNLVQFKVSLS